MRKPAFKSPTLGKSKTLDHRVAAALCNWFALNKRAMPWRETRDPYCIWLSEIMLQQTQVATVIPYYHRFLTRFPTVESLARAPLDDVLKLWAGLGYYSRARNLHRGAALVVERFGGRIPDSPEQIREIPGIGAYTAGAILSIAFARPEPLVDGNVARVLARMLLIKGDWRKGEVKEQLWMIVRELVTSSYAASAGTPGDLNQSLMELGATICTPKSPDCTRCPVAKFCLARKQGQQAEFPESPEKAEVPSWKLRAWIVEDSAGRILLARREESGLFGGLWEVPTERVTAAGKVKSAALGRVTHVLSHRRLDIHIHRISKEETDSRWQNAPQFPCWSGQYLDYRWLKLSDALSGNSVGLASVQRKVLTLAKK
jgi:A/G-specific adenine glycosylase